MFFPHKMTAIRSHDKVLEIGPGSSPHPRSNAFLERHFIGMEARISQRAGIRKDADFGTRPIHYYEGGLFPFHDNQFDYVICSHVVEHVIDPVAFMNEVFRVGSGRGYIEYPLITYEYLYDFAVHLHFVKFDFEGGVLRYLPKRETTLSDFEAVQSLFTGMLESGWGDLCAANKTLFFEGVEFQNPFDVKKTHALHELLPPRSLIIQKTLVRRLVGRILNSVGL